MTSDVRQIPALSLDPAFLPQGCIVGLKGSVDCPVGYLWRDERKHWFKYLPGYLASPNALPLHPIDLPLTSEVASSDGDGLDGRLATFGACQPARESQIATEILVEMALQEPVRQLMKTPLGVLVAASLIGGRAGLNGFYFDYSGWPDSRMNAKDREFWHPNSCVIPHSRARAALKNEGLPSCVANVPECFRPSPIEAVAVEADGRGGLIHVGYTDEHRLRHRLEAAYLTLADRCGVSVIDHHLLSHGALSAFWRNDPQKITVPLGGDHPEVVASRAVVMMAKNRIDSTEVFKRLCFLQLAGFSHRVYEHAFQIHLVPDEKSGDAVECGWELSPIKHLPIVGLQKHGFVSGAQRIKNLVGIGRLLGLPDTAIEKSLYDVFHRLSDWHDVAEKVGLTGEEVALYRPVSSDDPEDQIAQVMRQETRVPNAERVVAA